MYNVPVGPQLRPSSTQSTLPDEIEERRRIMYKRSTLPDDGTKIRAADVAELQKDSRSQTLMMKRMLATGGDVHTQAQPTGEGHHSPLLAADRALHLAQGLLAEPSPAAVVEDCDDPLTMEEPPERATFDPYLSQQPSQQQQQPLFHQASSTLP